MLHLCIVKWASCQLPYCFHAAEIREHESAYTAIYCIHAAFSCWDNTANMLQVYCNSVRVMSKPIFWKKNKKNIINYYLLNFPWEWDYKWQSKRIPGMQLDSTSIYILPSINRSLYNMMHKGKQLKNRYLQVFNPKWSFYLDTTASTECSVRMVVSTALRTGQGSGSQCRLKKGKFQLCFSWFNYWLRDYLNKNEHK